VYIVGKCNLFVYVAVDMRCGFDAQGFPGPAQRPHPWRQRGLAPDSGDTGGPRVHCRYREADPLSDRSRAHVKSSKARSSVFYDAATQGMQRAHPFSPHLHDAAIVHPTSLLSQCAGD
jgi:hypothetical protein